MQISTQSKIISKSTGNDLTVKIKNEPDFRKTVIKNVDKKIDKITKTEILKELELERLSEFVSDTSKYTSYNPGQISNITDGLENKIDVSFYDDVALSASAMALRKNILIYNKLNPKNKFDLSFFNLKNNDNKVELLFMAHKFNVEHPENTINLSELADIFDLQEAKKKFNDHKNYEPLPEGPIREVQIETKPAQPKKKAPIVVEKDINEMSFGELADYWNSKHPKAQIDSAYIWAQDNKKIQEMIYIASIYNLKFKNERIPIALFTGTEYDMAQKDEILTGLKYNLKNTKSPIPVKKYVQPEIPADNMRILNKIMRLMAEYNVPADIDFIITNCTDRQSLNDKYEQLFATK